MVTAMPEKRKQASQSFVIFHAQQEIPGTKRNSEAQINQCGNASAEETCHQFGFRGRIMVFHQRNSVKSKFFQGGQRPRRVDAGEAHGHRVSKSKIIHGAPGVTRTRGTQIRNLIFWLSHTFPRFRKKVDFPCNFKYNTFLEIPKKSFTVMKKSCTGVVQVVSRTKSEVPEPV
jgi:hypothetical protein